MSTAGTFEEKDDPLGLPIMTVSAPQPKTVDTLVGQIKSNFVSLIKQASIGPLRKVEDESGSYEYESADISLTVTADLLARVRREALASNVLTERFIQSTQELIEVATLLRVRNVVHDPIRASNTTAELSKTFQQRTNETAKSLAVIEADLLLMEQEVCESLRRSADVYRIVNKGSG